MTEVNAQNKRQHTRSRFTIAKKIIYVVFSIILILNLLDVLQISAMEASEEVEEEDSVLGLQGHMPVDEGKEEYGFLPMKERNVWSKRRQIQDTMALLFPNRTNSINFPSLYGNDDYHLRKLAVTKKPYGGEGTITCTPCDSLQVCDILNGKQIQEVYYPSNPEYKETCKVLEALGTRMSAEIFGNGRTFRDTPQCRAIVMQYLCLFYGSNNPMYTNYCVFEEDVTDAIPANHKVAPLPPCKSFCVQVVTVCANEQDLIGTCDQIRCSSLVEESCTPDPQIESEVLDARLGCDVPYDQNPYFKAAAGRTYRGLSLYSLSLALVVASCVMVGMI